MVKIDLQQGDCLELMQNIPNESIDLILCDPPYGTIKGLSIDGWQQDTTSWDNRLPTDKLFANYERILKPNCPVILFSQEPYTSLLRTNTVNNLPFSYSMIWEKKNWSNPLMWKKKPLNVFEDISVFYKQYESIADTPLRKYSKQVFNFICEHYQVKYLKEINQLLGHQKCEHFFRFSSTQIALPSEKGYQDLTKRFNLENMQGYLTYSELKKLLHKRIFNVERAIGNVFQIPKESNNIHPTQKPLALLETLIKMYTNEGMTVLDNCFGSCSTGIACLKTNRNFIGMELDDKYFKIGQERINNCLKEDDSN